MKVFVIGLILFGTCWVPQVSAAEASLSTRLRRDNYVYSTAMMKETSSWQIGIKSDAQVQDGKLVILFYAGEQASELDDYADGQPDVLGFDFLNVTATCPQNLGSYNFIGSEAATKAASLTGMTMGGAYYHAVECEYTGSLKDQDLGYTNQNFIQVLGVLNPLQNSTWENLELIYSPVWVLQLAADGSIASAQMQTVTSSRAVQMLAEIAPQISFRIEGLGAGGTYCGVTNRQTTGSGTASFGQISTSTFANLAQRLRVTTNTDVGYVLQAQMDDQMRLSTVNSCVSDGSLNSANCLPSARVLGMDATTSASWTSPTQGAGLAFTLENVKGGDAVFTYNQGYRHFADHEDGQKGENILATSTQRESVNNICYRLLATPQNLNGVYQNQITYTLVAKF